MLCIFLIDNNTSSHELYKPWSILIRRHGWDLADTLLLDAVQRKVFLEKIFDFFFKMIVLQIVDDADVVNVFSIFWDKSVPSLSNFKFLSEFI